MAVQFMFNKTVLPLAMLTCLVRKLYSVGTVLYASGLLTVFLDSTHGVHSCFSSCANHKMSVFK